jgi:DNA-binding transcriptional MerR regulator
LIFTVKTVDSVWCDCYIDSVTKELQKFADESFVGVNELATAAKQVLISTEIFQDRESVTALPDERTIRYYITEGLVSPAEEKQGTSSVFGYLQLLQLLVIKKLQAENLSIRQIRQIVVGRKERELEQLLEEKEAAESKNDAQKFLESLLVGKQQSTANFSQPQQRTAPTLLQTQVSPKSESVWRRFEIAPDLELHVGDNFDAPTDNREFGKLLQKFQQIVESLRKGKK